MTGESRPLDYLTTHREEFPTAQSAIDDFRKNGRLTTGAQNAINQFYKEDSRYLTLKNGTSLKIRKGRVIIRKKGKFVSHRGYGKWIKKLKAAL